MSNNMDIRCVALDIDGTILGHSKELSKKNKYAIEEVLKRGIEVVVASGRAYESLPSCITQIPGIQYAITSNGAAIYHIASNECIQQYKLSHRAVEQIMNATEDEPVLYEVFIDGKAYTDAAYVLDPMSFGAGEHVVNYIQSTRIPIENMKQFIMDHQGELDSLALINRTQDTVKPVWEKLEKRVDDVYITTSVPKLIEIADERAGKKAALKYILEILQLSREQSAAFGNADNDWEMIEYAGWGVAVADASERCKSVADFVTKTCDEDGVAFALQKILKKE